MERNETTFDCGGTLISDKFVLTAAHCANRKDQEAPFIVRLGRTSMNLNDRRDTGIALDVFIQKIHLAKEYSYMTKRHDIALLELETPIDFSKKDVCEYIEPACLPLDDPSTSQTENRHFTIIGFGKSSTRNTKSPWLMKANATEYPRAECAREFAPATTIFDSQICASDPKSGADACEGDSGSALQVQNKDLYIVHGITSYGYLCGSKTPSIYTKVASYLPWVESIVWP